MSFGNLDAQLCFFFGRGGWEYKNFRCGNFQGLKSVAELFFIGYVTMLGGVNEWGMLTQNATPLHHTGLSYCARKWGNPRILNVCTLNVTIFEQSVKHESRQRPTPTMLLTCEVFGTVFLVQWNIVQQEQVNYARQTQLWNLDEQIRMRIDLYQAIPDYGSAQALKIQKFGTVWAQKCCQHLKRVITIRTSCSFFNLVKIRWVYHNSFSGHTQQVNDVSVLPISDVLRAHFDCSQRVVFYVDARSSFQQ